MSVFPALARKLWFAKLERPNWVKKLVWPLFVPLMLAGLILIYGLSCGRIVLNASDSLAARGFYVVIWPKPLIRGSVVVVNPPASLADRFEGLLFTKRLVGLPGDEITHQGGALCVDTQCFERAKKDGVTFGELTPTGIIPKGRIALFGETATSLDSRYAGIGLFPTSDIHAVGFAIPGFPSWQDLKDWMDQ